MPSGDGFDTVRALRTMAEMRAFEELVGQACASREIHGEMHLAAGQEAIAAALEQLLRPGDQVVSTHRPHLHALAARVDPVEMIAEILEREGLCAGKGGHMHIFDPAHGFMCNGIVGAGAPLAAGFAFAQLRAGTDSVTVCVLGDGAMNQGAVFETLNLAALWELPILFLCEDNGYGISVARDSATAGTLEARGQAFGIEGTRCDGTDVEETFLALQEAFLAARRRKPSLVVASCYRYRGHYEGDLDQYRGEDEKTEAMSDARDPIARLSSKLAGSSGAQADLDGFLSEAHDRVSAWFDAAREKPFPDVESLRQGLFI